MIFDGGTVRMRLIVLILVPSVGLGAAAALVVSSRASSAQSAAAAERTIRAVTLIQAAKSALEQERIPAVVAVLAEHPELLVGLTADDLKSAPEIVPKLPGLRASTDKAFAALSGSSLDPSLVAGYGADLIKVRAQIDNSRDLTTALNGANTLLATMSTTADTELATAVRVGLDSAGNVALRDVSLAQAAAQTGANETGSFTGTQFPETSGPTAPQLSAAWAQSYGAYAAASTALLTLGSAALVADWRAANADPAAQAYNDFLSVRVAVSGSPAPIGDLITLVIEDGPRNAAYAKILGSALSRALAAGTAQRNHAVVALYQIIGVVVALLLISFAVAAWVRRSITIPIAGLAAQGTRISQGELIDVQVIGPSEIRTAARALSSSVASLRNIQAQAAAVASGDLENPVVRQALPGPLGEVVHSSVTTIIDAIHDRETARTALAHLAAHDALTGLPNRAEALNLIRRALQRAQRSAAKTALMFIDLDHFKAVNDTFGHAAGDEVLRVVSRRLQTIVRDGDIVARLGGDEFVLLLEAIDDEADIAGLAERLVAELSAEMLIQKHSLQVGASVGLAFCRDGYVDAGRLLQEADAAAYRAKHSGGGRVDIFDDGLRAELTHRAELERAIAAGLISDEFVLYYQPVIDLRSGETYGVEALIRWQHPVLGLILPDDFIPIAEQSSLINDIGRWVLRTATAQLAVWNEESGAPLTMAVNISGRHLASSQLIPDVRHALAASKIAPNQLIVEVTETVLVDDPLATQNMRALRDLGVKISIDDFGSGFTSIGQLPRLQVDTLKIDRSFIASNDFAQQELVRLIVASAHAFGLTVVAEGIAEPDQEARLRGENVEYGQGFLFSRPQPGHLLNLRRSPSDPRDRVTSRGLS